MADPRDNVVMGWVSSAVSSGAPPQAPQPGLQYALCPSDHWLVWKVEPDRTGWFVQDFRGKPSREDLLALGKGRYAIEPCDVRSDLPISNMREYLDIE